MVADDARRVYLGDFSWRVNDKFTYTYDFGDYWQHKVRVEKLLAPAAVPTSPVCLSGRRACPLEEVGDPSGYDQRTLDQFSWRYESLARLLAGEDIREDDVPTWFWTSTSTKTMSIENWTECIRLVPELKVLQTTVMLNAVKHLGRFLRTVQRCGRDASLRSA